MKKYIVIPDSFKGTLSSQEVCRHMRRGILLADEKADVVTIPVADGGEGTVDAFLQAVGGSKRAARVRGPLGETIDSFYGRLSASTAVVEMAAAAGLPLVEHRKDPEKTTTYGVGQLILQALEDGATEVILGLGGSCTNDGGCGMAAALGVRFYDETGEAFVPTGGTLRRIDRVDAGGLHPLMREAKLRVMCDIDNPLCGPQGAAAVFAPQKGADEVMVGRLDAGLAHFAAVVKRDLGSDILHLPGAGAAGGMGGGAVALLGGTLQMGIDAVLDTVGFERILQEAGLVLTGEGKLDGQSLRGKVIVGVTRYAAKAGVPVFAFAGALVGDSRPFYDAGLTAMFSINRAPLPYEEAVPHSAENLAEVVQNAVRCYLAGRNA